MATNKFLYRLVLIVDGVPMKGAPTAEWPIVEALHTPGGQLQSLIYRNEKDEPGLYVVHTEPGSLKFVGVEVITAE